MDFTKTSATSTFFKKCGLLSLVGGLHCAPLAAQFDNELVFLVDAGAFTSAAERNSFLNGIASSFESGSLIDAISAGDISSITSSVVVYGGTAQQDVAISEFIISDITSAASFASQIRLVGDTIPTLFDGFPTLAPASVPALSAAIDFATNLITTSGLASDTQAIQFYAEISDLGGVSPFDADLGRTNTITASQNAAAAGIDGLSGVFGNAVTDNIGVATDFFPTGLTTLEAFQDDFNTNIVFGQPEGGSGLAIIDNDVATPTTEDQEAINNVVLQAAAVPEPSTASLALLLVPFLLRRKRNTQN